MAVIDKPVIEITATDQTQQAFNAVKNSLKQLGGFATTALASLGVGAGVGIAALQFKSMIEGTINATAKLHDLSTQTGITVETLSGLREVAKLGGIDLDTAAGLVNKLQKNMTEFSQTGAGKAADAFKQLGYSQAQVKAGLQDMDKFLPQFAKRLVETGVGGEQAGLAMQLLAKGGATALPFLKELAEAGGLVVRVTTEQAAAADLFEDNLVRLKTASDQVKISFSNALLPALNEITQAMLDGRKAGDGFFGALFEGAKKTLQIFAGWNNAGDLDRVNKDIDALTKKLSGLYEVQSTGAKVQRQIDKTVAELAVLNQKATTLQKIAELEKPGALTTPSPVKAKKPLDDLPDKAKAVKDLTSEYERLARIQVEGDERAAQETAEAWKAWEKIRVDDHKAAEEAKALATKQMFEQIDAEQERAVQATRDYLDALKKDEKGATNVAHEFGLVLTSAFGQAIREGGNLRDTVKSLGIDIAQLITKITILKPLEKGIEDAFKGAGGTSGIFDSIKGLFGSGSKSGGVVLDGNIEGGLIGAFASGTNFVPRDGLAIVHKGEAIIPAARNRGGGGTVNNFTVDMRGASVDAVARLEQLFMQVNGSIERRALNVMGQARTRGAT